MLQPSYRFTWTRPITVEQSPESSTLQVSNIWSSGGSPDSEHGDPHHFIQSLSF